VYWIPLDPIDGFLSLFGSFSVLDTTQRVFFMYYLHLVHMGDTHGHWFMNILLELIHTHLGFIFPKVFPCLLVIISHYPVSYILGENIPPGEYSLSVDTSV
jgi:hypothetical protein